VEERLLLQLKDQKPELYSLFTAARTIENKPGSHNSKNKPGDNPEDIQPAPDETKK
jgi:hypothetical protein